MKTVKELRNELMKRNEMGVILESNGNPSYENVTKLIADNYKVKEDTIVINTIKSRFGRNTFLIDFYIYDNVESKMNIEPKIKEKKSKK